MYPLTTKQSKESEKRIKDKILNSAYNLFISNGYYNVTILKIAEDANISSNSIYNYYSGKTSILKSLVEKHFKTGLKKNSKKLSGNDYIKYLIDQTFEQLENHCNFLRVIYPMIFFTNSFHYLKDFLYQFTLEHINRLEEAFTELGYKDPFDEARGLITEIDGINLHYMTVQSMYPVEDVKEMLYSRYNLK